MTPPPADGLAARFVLGPALRTQPDRRLIALVREGYENAFEEIVRRYGRSLNRYAAAIVGGRAEDVTQDAFSKALLALRRDGAEIELRPWLFRIVRNTALNELRDRPASPEELAEAIAGGASPAEELERREELADLMRRLQSLPESQRAAIVMREMEGLSHDEIAAALGVSGGAARQAIHRARVALRNGAGMLVPLPLLKALLATSAMGPAEVAAGAGGAAGAGVALKAAAATVLIAGAVGAGVAVHEDRHSGRAPEAPSTSAGATSPADMTVRSAAAAPVAALVDDRSRHGGDEHGGRGKSATSGEHSGDGRGSGGDHGSRGTEPSEDHGDQGNGGGEGHGGGEPGDDHGGRDGHTGGGPGPSGDDGSRGSSRQESSHSGSGGSGSGDGSGHGGDGHGGDLAVQGTGGGPGPSEEPVAPEEGSGGGGPGPSGGSGSDSGSGSGSGSGDGSGGGGDHVDD